MVRSNFKEIRNVSDIFVTLISVEHWIFRDKDYTTYFVNITWLLAK